MSLDPGLHLTGRLATESRTEEASKGVVRPLPGPSGTHPVVSHQESVASAGRSPDSES